MVPGDPETGNTGPYFSRIYHTKFSGHTVSIKPGESGPLCERSAVFPKWCRTFIEFSEFRESDILLKHELGSI